MTRPIAVEAPARSAARAPLRRKPREPDLPAITELREAVCELVRAHQSRDRDLAGAYGLSPSALHALGAIARGQAETVGRLAAALVVGKSTASRIAAGLEEKRLVEYAPDPGDRRIQRLRITAEGQRIHGRIEADAVRDMEETLRLFGARRSRELAAGIRALARRERSGAER